MDIPKPALFGFDLGGEAAFYLRLAVCRGACFSFRLIGLPSPRFRAGIGRNVTGRGSGRAAAALRSAFYKSKCFLVAAFAAGIAGGLYAYHSRYLNPNDFPRSQKSIDVLIMVVIGGLGSLPGAGDRRSRPLC